MDPFTQRMMERARIRREKLDQELAAVGQLDIKRRRMPLLENNPEATTSPASSAIIEEVKSPRKESLKRASPVASPQKPTLIEDVVEKENSCEVDENNSENAQPTPSSLHSKLNRLGKLYAGAENMELLSSPVHHRTETLSRYEIIKAPSNQTSKARTARLAALARSIEEWEDDLSTITPTPKKEAPKTLSVPASPAKTTATVPASPTTSTTTVSASPVKAISTSTRQVSSPAKSTTPVKMPTRALVSSPARSPAPASSPANSPAPSSAASPRGVQMGSRALQSNKSPVRVTSFIKKTVTKNVKWNEDLLASLEEERELRGRMLSGEDIAEENEDSSSEPASPCTGSVSSPGWVYRAGSPMKPRMGLQSPVKKLSAAAPSTPSPVKTSTSSPVKPAGSPLRRSPSKSTKNISPGSVLQKAAMFESVAAICSSPTVDPASLPLAQRKALFEKNKSQGPLIPKVAFATPLPAKLISQCTAVEKPKPGEAPKAKAAEVPKTKVSEMPKPKPAEIREPAIPRASIMAAATKVLAQKAMFEQGAQDAPKHTDVVAASLTERQRELEQLRSRWDKQKQMANKCEEDNPHAERVQTDLMRQRWARETHQQEAKKPATQIGTPPPPPPMPSATTPSPTKSASPVKSTTSPSRKYPGIDSVRKIKVSPPKAGRIYPSLSDIDATESEMDADTSGGSYHSTTDASASDTSFGDEILQAAGLHRDKTPAKRVANEMTSSERAVINEIDEFLDEALGSDDESTCTGPTPPKKSKEYYEEDDARFRTPALRPAPPPPSYVVEQSGQPQPLLHTVSFYRKQQAAGARKATPVKQIVRHPDSESDSDEDHPKREERAVERKIQALQEEVSKQQTVISQASQGLNLCRSTVEFCNSTEQVEFERLLLVATHRRQALLHEIQRLKLEGTLFKEHTETGSLTISNLSLPLKREFLCNMRRGTDDNIEHYVVCLVRCQEHLIASPLMATSSVPGNQEVLNFPGTLTLEDLGSDFAINLEVYTLQVRRETISHEEKYHIKKEASKIRLTPKKHKHDNLLVMPVMQSPAGPSAVRSPSFILAGYTVFSLREIGRSHFTLNKVPFTSPLEGHVDMKLSCKLNLDTEMRGFLTMFDDISGYGAWHRRWCVLEGSQLSYWKYPDDEKKKTPIGSLDLRKSCTKEVGPVSRDICARPYTFILETRREPRASDEESLVMIPGEQFTTLRHLLSADTKDERIQWCNVLNRALSLMRAWRASTSSQKSAVATSL